MDNNIILPKNDFDFENITVLSPSTIQGKTFLSKIQNDNNDLYIQTPKCISKNGFVTSGKKTYIDLLFEKDNDEFIEWFENLENKIQQEIYKKRERWFRGENIEQSDIEDIFTSPIKTYKSGKYYSIRVNLGSPRIIQHIPLNIFDENENQLEMDDIQPNTKMITILQLHGLKFNVNINFQIYIELKQILTVDDEKMFKKPLFKVNNTKKINQDTTQKINQDTTQKINQDNTLEELQNKTTHLSNVSMPIIKTEPLGETEPIGETEPLVVTEYLGETDPLVVTEHLGETEKMVKDNNSLEEYNPDILNISDSFTIKKPDDVYNELYKTAKEKAKNARLHAIKAYMELKHIKQNYQIDDLDSENDFSESEFQSSDEESENEEDTSPKLDFIELR